MVVLDTDFLIDAMAAEDAAVERLDELLDGYRPVAVSAISVMQLHHGIERSSRPRAERERVTETLASLLTYPVDGSVAAQAGTIDGRLTSEGERIGASDVLIGATALDRDEPVLTRNTEHFERIPGLEVETY